MARLSFCTRLFGLDEENVNEDCVTWKMKKGRQLMKLEVTTIIIIIIIIIIIGIGIQPLGRSGQRPEFSQATDMALVRCILGKFLGVACHCFPPNIT